MFWIVETEKLYCDNDGWFDAGRQALKEYEARQPCDVANGDNDAAG